jgi:hypothetical protein
VKAPLPLLTMMALLLVARSDQTCCLTWHSGTHAWQHWRLNWQLHEQHWREQQV